MNSQWHVKSECWLKLSTTCFMFHSNFNLLIIVVLRDFFTNKSCHVAFLSRFGLAAFTWIYFKLNIVFFVLNCPFLILSLFAVILFFSPLLRLAFENISDYSLRFAICFFHHCSLVFLLITFLMLNHIHTVTI